MYDGSWCLCNKDEHLQVLKVIIDQEDFPFVWYDDKKYLYATEDLTLKFKKEYQCEISHQITGQKNKYRFLIVNLVKTQKLKTIFDFIEKKISERPYEPVMILEALFKQTQISNMIIIDNQFFSKYQRLDDIGRNKKKKSI